MLEQSPSRLARWIMQAGFSNVFIHLDVDAINPLDFPHSKPCPPQGLSFNCLLKIVEELNIMFKVVGLGITEFHPGNEKGIATASRLIDKALPNFLHP